MVLIEKCTHVKGTKRCCTEKTKIKWHKRCLSVISVLLRKLYTSRTDEGGGKIWTIFHIHHKTEYSTSCFSQVFVVVVVVFFLFPGVLRHPVLNNLSLKPDTSVLTEFVHILSPKTSPCVQYFCNWPPTAEAAMSFTGTKGPLNSVFFSFSFK